MHYHRHAEDDYGFGSGALASGGSRRLLAALVLGALAGAAVMLFVAPRTGRELRSQLMKKGGEMGHRMLGRAEGLLPFRRRPEAKMLRRVRRSAAKLREAGQELVGKTTSTMAGAVHRGR